MGTSSSYGGSRGSAWRRARSRARHLPEIPSGADIDDLVADIAVAMGWSDDEVGDGANADDGAEAAPPAAPGQPIGAWGPISARRAAGAGGGGGGGAGGGRARDGGGHRGAGGGNRTRRAAARVAGRVARIAYGVATGDARLLEDLGLRLADFVGLTIPQQAQRIAEAAIGATIEEAELDKAITRMTLAILNAGGEMSPAEAARQFVEAYTWEIMLTEIGEALRTAGHSDTWSCNIERMVRENIRATVQTYDLDEAAGLDQVGPLIERALAGGREVMMARGVA